MTNSIEDAEDLFILAKDRLLDVNDWNEGNGNYTLTDSHKHKLHRNAHTGDFIKAGEEQWLVINKIQYDDYPDVNGESITLFLSYTNDTESMHTVAVNRVGKVLTIQGYNLDFATDADSFLKNMIRTDEYAIAS